MHRVGPARPVPLGFASMAIGYLLLLRIDSMPQWATVLLPTTLLVGIGIGIAFPALNVLATSGIAPHEQGIAAAVFQASNQIGAALVLAIVTAVVSRNGAAGFGPEAPFGAYRDGLYVVAAVAVAGLLIALTALLPLRRANPTELGAETSA